jgi:Protein of unknown function (DUF1579)
MQKTCVLLTLIVFCFLTPLRAQTSAPKPDPELKKLHVLVGHWTYEGEYKPGVLGPGGIVKGVWDARIILGGFFLREEVSEKIDEGESHALGIESYDPERKEFVTNWYQSNGSRFTGTLTIAGNIVVWTGPAEIGGTHYLFRETFVCEPDFMSGTSKRDFSSDGGKTWIPYWEAKFVKAKPAATKN